MARLPDPICDELEADWAEDYDEREDSIYTMVAIVIRRIESRKEKKEGDEKEDKD